jgi:hypothetical protein
MNKQFVCVELKNQCIKACYIEKPTRIKKPLWNENVKRKNQLDGKTM